MEIGRRLRELRECRHLSQGDLERRTGLLRCYTSRVENGHTVPSVETIEKYAIALGIPLVAFFSKNLSSPPAAPPPSSEDSQRRPTSKEQLQKQQLAKALAALDSQDRQLLVALALRLVKGNRMKRHKPDRRAALPVEMRATKEQRRSPRILATVPLEIHSSSESLEAVTAVINLQGALILSPLNWPKGTVLTIDSKKTGLQVRGRVVWSGSRELSGLHKLGVEFASAAPEFWADQYGPQVTEAS